MFILSRKLRVAFRLPWLHVQPKRINTILLLVFSSLVLRADFVRADWAFDLQVDGIVRAHEFNLVRWEVDSLMEKLRDAIRSPVRGMDERQKAALVRAYFDNAARIRELNAQINRDLANAATSSDVAAWQNELDALRRQQIYWRPMVEAAIEGQISSVLRANGLETAGVLWPPVRFSLAEPPLFLVVSPRAQIARRYDAYLQPETSIPEREKIEAHVDKLADVRSLVEGTGGFSTWPTMVLDDASLAWVLGTVAHEWMHTYLVFYPLGWRYYDSRDMTTMNETIASIVGDEIGAQTLARFYPELVSPPEPTPSNSKTPLARPAFDFGAEMRSTRLAVDALLAAGRKNEAEAFMEVRRQRFVKAGYALRKLNQAYFSFYGSYATGSSNVDPIGPKLRTLREQKNSLADFVFTVRDFAAPADLDAVLKPN